MKNLINKVRHHGKKITIHLKRHHRKYLFGALCSGILALIAVHTASTVNNIFANTYDQELEQGFIYAKNRGLTDAENIDNANLSDSVSKIELADIISNYSINVLNLELDDTKECGLPSDVSGELNAEYHSGYTNLCQLGILIETGVNFNPTDTGTKAIFGTWLSRALNANNTGLLGELNSIEPYYSGHLNWLYEQELLDNIEDYDVSIVKGYLFVYLMKSDKTLPICNIEYNITGWTNQTVTATLTGCNKTGISVTRPNGSWTYPFNTSGSFTFEFVDAVGNTGSTVATVTWIDKTKPECGVWYETQGETGNESKIARLTGCTEEITVTNNSGNRYYLIGYSGEFTFEFRDRAYNTGIAKASVNMPKYPIEVENSGKMLSLYSGNGAISCEHYYRSGDISETFKLYMKTGAVSLNIEMTGNGNFTDGNELFINDRIYQWGSMYSLYFGTGEGLYTQYELDIRDLVVSLFNSLGTGDKFWCTTGIDNTGAFDLPGNIRFYKQGHNSFDNGIYFSISIDDTINAGEYTDFTVKVIKNGQLFKDYTGTIYFDLTDKDGKAVDVDEYDIREEGFYDFETSDHGKKKFIDGLKIKKTGTYNLKVYDLHIDSIEGSEVITVKKGTASSHNNYDDFEYDTYKFNPNYSDEMNEAYQYARYYDITTIDSIKNAKMDSGLNRIAMAKMLTNYAVNVLGIDDFDTSRNCTFKDVSTTLDREYDYGVTRACQLGIMGVNMPNNKFYPNGGVTRAEFATALSRLLFDTEDGDVNYFSTHISKLKKEGIINNTNPKLREKRGYVMLMLMRADGKYDD